MEHDKMSGKPLTKEQQECPAGAYVSICSSCHKFLGYVLGAKVENTGEFSHGICCACLEKMYCNEPFYKKEMGEE
jgi:hypothetical protein